jgi:hypothetical protein
MATANESDKSPPEVEKLYVPVGQENRLLMYSELGAGERQHHPLLTAPPTFCVISARGLPLDCSQRHRLLSSRDCFMGGNFQ